MDPLENPIQHYAWGSRTVIGELQGRPVPTAKPEAELWLGAHPMAPSRIPRGGALRPLSEVIGEDPEAELGRGVVERYGPRLPFLLKVLAAEEPLSLQAHPSMEQARAGFAQEELAGVPIDAPERCYRDQSHKPELLCALTPFEALCGFRARGELNALCQLLQVPALTQLLEGPLEQSFTELLALEGEPKAELIRDVVDACTRLTAHDRFGASAAWVVRLAKAYPGDVGAVSSLLLNLVVLAPNEAMYLPAGNLHAYLRGAGIEIMASSDNVLRGGLTVKHVDRGELLKVLDFSPFATTLAPCVETSPGRFQYQTEANEFVLERLELAHGRAMNLDQDGPEILLCTAGHAQLTAGPRTLQLKQGDSCFIPSGSASRGLTGEATLFRASVRV